MYGTNKLSSQLVINKKIKLVGADSNALIESTEDYKIYTDEKDKPKNNLITVQADGVKISNLSVRHNKKLGFGIHVYGVNGVKLTNVKATDCGKGGLLVNSATVTADGLTTSGNGWYGVDVDERIENTTKVGKLPATFTLTNSDESISEPIQVYAENGTVNWNGSHKYLEKAKVKNKEEYYDKGYIYSKRTEEKFTKGAVVKPANKDNTQLVGDYYEDVKKAIEVGSGKTVEIYGEYTIPASTTVEIKGTVTGTIKGTNNTSKLTVGENGAYGELVKGTYVWINDSWVKEGTNIITNGELNLGESNGNKELKTSFTWSSSNGIGSVDEQKSGNYNYYKDGVYLRFQVKENNKVKKFSEVFASAEGGANEHKKENYANCGMTLQTDGGSVNDMESSYREKYDWGSDRDSEKAKESKTRLPNDDNNLNYIFYGLVQDKEKYNGVKTVGFEAGDSRNINMVLRPKADLADGTYTVTVELVQQGNESKSLGTIDYTFTVNADKTITVK